MPHATSSGLDWPFRSRKRLEKKLADSAVREVTKRARAKIKAMTDRSQVGPELGVVIGRLNRFLRGWGNYFRTGNASIKFCEIDKYVWWRMFRLLVKKRGHNLRAGQADRWTSAWFHDEWFVSLARHYPIPECSVTMSRRPSVSRMRENRTYGLKGGMGNRPRKSTAPLTSNGGLRNQVTSVQVEANCEDLTETEPWSGLFEPYRIRHRTHPGIPIGGYALRSSLTTPTSIESDSGMGRPSSVSLTELPVAALRCSIAEA